MLVWFIASCIYLSQKGIIWQSEICLSNWFEFVFYISFYCHTFYLVYHFWYDGKRVFQIWAHLIQILVHLSYKIDMQDCQSLTYYLSWTLHSLAKCTQLKSFYRFYFGNVHLNWLKWFNFLILEESLPAILIDCMIFLSPFLDVTRICLCQHFLSLQS